MSGSSANDICLGAQLDSFRVEAPSCDVEVAVEWTEKLPGVEGKRLFDSGALWTLCEDNAELIFDFTTPVLGHEPYKRLHVDREFCAARLLLRRCNFPMGAGIAPLEYPLDELLITHRLSSKKGVEVHGCGLVDAERGAYLFIGHSGAGKSTTTRLWKAMRAVQVLSDDRIILRQHGREIWMYGTPWHGEDGFASPKRARVGRIFVLEHGQKAEISRLSHSRAVAELFARCFVPFHNHRQLECALACLQNVASSVPCYLYHFLPDASAVEAILDFYD